MIVYILLTNLISLHLVYFWFINCFVLGVPGGYANVASYNKWIKETVEKLDDTKRWLFGLPLEFIHLSKTIQDHFKKLEKLKLLAFVYWLKLRIRKFSTIWAASRTIPTRQIIRYPFP